MNNFRIGLCSIFALFGSSEVLAYPMKVHLAITSEAVKHSVLSNDPTVLARLHLLAIDNTDQKFATSAEDGNDTDSPDFTDYCVHGDSYTVIGIMECASEFEDSPGKRSFNHFDDWQGGNVGLNIAGLSLGLPSPIWIGGGMSNQKYSFGDAEKYFYIALTSSTEADRKSNFGLMFQSLGQSVHHIQDMAQPQHVRNDAHCDNIICLPLLQYNPSRYEAYTFNSQIMRQLASQADGNSIYPGMRGTFRTLRDFWDGPSGMATYTSMNYVSSGTNFAVDDTGHTTRPTEKYPEPAWPIGDGQPIKYIYPNESIPTYITSFCSISYVDCNVASVDTSFGLKNVASLSIFDGDLRLVTNTGATNTSEEPPGQYSTTRVFSLNNSNYLAAARDLVPRASAFSSGVINFFFRGVLTVSPPDRGAYAYLDMSDQACNSGACGFKQLKLKVINANPSEQTPQGSIYAVAKYHLNTGFKSDFSMQYNIPGVGTGFRSPDEKISVSTELQSQSISSSESVPLTFDFSANPIPIAATDLYIQVIYRGNLGSEVGTGVALGELDISEPTAYELQNNDDYTINIQMCSPFAGRISDGSVGTGVSVSYSLKFGADIASVTTGILARGDHAKFAFLTDANGFPIYISSNKGDSNQGETLTGDVEQLDKDGVLLHTSQYKNRGGWFAGDNAFIWDYGQSETGSVCNISPITYAFLYPAFQVPLKPFPLVF